MNYRSTKLACYSSYIVQAVVNNFLPILFIIFQQDYHLSYEQLGRIIFINFFTQLVSDAATPYIIKFTGYRRAAIICHLMVASGLCMLSVLPAITDNIYPVLVLSVIVYAFGGGIIEVLISPMIELIPGKNKAADMAFLHSFYCWGQAAAVLVTTALVFLLGTQHWRIIPLVWLVIPLTNVIMFTRVPINEPEEEKAGETSKKLFHTRDFWCFAVFMICAGASEIAMSEWTSVFAQNALGVNKFVGDLLGPCAFAVFMGIGRVVFGAAAGRFSVKRALIVNNILCFLCYITVAVIPSPVPALLACALCGFSVSLSWPGTYSMASSRFPTGGTLMFGIFAFCGDFGCSTGPWLLGAVADAFSLNTGFLVCSIFPAIMVITALLLKENG